MQSGYVTLYTGLFNAPLTSLNSAAANQHLINFTDGRLTCAMINLSAKQTSNVIAWRLSDGLCDNIEALSLAGEL
jgi:hypothetical protein